MLHRVDRFSDQVVKMGRKANVVFRCFCLLFLSVMVVIWCVQAAGGTIQGTSQTRTSKLDS